MSRCQSSAVQIGVEMDALILLGDLERLLEQAVIEAEHDVGIHLDEAAIAVPGEARRRPRRRRGPRTVSSLRPRLRTVSIIPGIDTRAPERTETSSGSAASPKLLPVDPLDMGDAVGDLGGERVAEALALVIIERAGRSRDGEAGRHRQADRGHFGEVRALAAEQLLIARLAVGDAAAEAVDEAGHRTSRPAGRFTTLHDVAH